MKLEIITPAEILFNGEVSLVQLPGVDGLFEVLENHASLVATLQKGRVKITGVDRRTQYVEIRGGAVEVLDNRILVLAE